MIKRFSECKIAPNRENLAISRKPAELLVVKHHLIK